MVTDDDIKRYLEAALDQSACKATLRSALISRVDSLRERGINQPKLLFNLRRMGEDFYQLNDDVIWEVIEEL